MKHIQYEKFSEYDSYLWLFWFLIYWERGANKRIIAAFIGFYPDYENLKWSIEWKKP